MRSTTSAVKTIPAKTGLEHRTNRSILTHGQVIRPSVAGTTPKFVTNLPQKPFDLG
jgi:hypothetical protein